MDPLEIAAVILGIACVYLTIRENILCWPVGLLQVALYLVIFYRVRLYSDMALQGIYILLQVYGWVHWSRGGQRSKPLVVSRLSRSEAVFSAGGIIVLAGALGWTMSRLTDAALPYPDAFTTVASLAAQWMLALKRLEAWIIWVMVDILSIFIYTNRGLHLTAGLYAVFLVMASFGFLSWKNPCSKHDWTHAG